MVAEAISLESKLGVAELKLAQSYESNIVFARKT